jgi:hypothetical protein
LITPGIIVLEFIFYGTSDFRSSYLKRPDYDSFATLKEDDLLMGGTDAQTLILLYLVKTTAQTFRMTIP